MKNLTFVIALLMLASCSTTRPPSQGTAANIAAAKADVKTADVAVDGAFPFTQDAGKSYLTTAKTALHSATSHLGDATKSDDQESKDAAALQKKYDIEHNSTWAKIGRFIYRFAWILGSAYVLSMIGGVLLKVYNPTGWGFTLGRQIFQALPFSNPASAVADRLIRARNLSPNPATEPKPIKKRAK